MLTRQVEAAQKRVEGNNYDTRKQVLQYDDVMREQREIIYAQRYDVITADRDLAPEIQAMIKRTIGRVVDGHARAKQDEKLEAILNFAKYNLLPEDSITMEDLSGLSDKAIKEELFQRALQVYDSQVSKLRDEEAVKEFQKVFKQYSVYARVSPEHKVRIVKAWQKEGKVVAMTGDGVNDAPSLKTADIGIGMGITGTEVSKGASDMVLADDNFATIIVAVEEGRKVFSNIQKTIQYLLSANTAEVLTIFLSTLFGWDVLQPVHLLWINLVTDTFPAIALGVEPAEPGVMNHKPRGRKASFFSGGVLSSIIYQGVLQATIVMSVYGLAIAYPVHVGDNHAIHADALTMAFATLGLIQLFHAYNVKSVYQSILTVGPFKSKTFNWSILVSFILLMAIIVVEPLEGIFHVTKLDLSQWRIVMGGSFSMIIIVEIVKFIQRKLGFDKNAI